MSRTFVFIVGWIAVELQQGPIEPLALGNETRMVFPQSAQALKRFFVLLTRLVPTACDISLRTFELDLGSAAGALVPQLHLIVANDAFDQLMSCQHSVSGTLQIGHL